MNNSDILDDVLFEERNNYFSKIALSFTMLSCLIFAVYLYWMNPEYYSDNSRLPDQVSWFPSLTHKIGLWITLGIGVISTFLAFWFKEKNTWYKVAMGIVNSIIVLVITLSLTLLYLGFYG